MNDTVKASTGRRYSFWEALGFSFFSKDLYSDVGKNWKGTAYGWLFLMVLLMSILPAVNFQMFVSANLPDLMKKIPDFQVVNGEFSSSIKQPFIYKWDKGELIVDTTGKYDSLDKVPKAEEMESVFLVNKDKLISHRIRLGQAEDKTSKMPKFDSFIVNQENLARWAGIVIHWSGAACFVLFTVFLSIVEAVVMLFYGLFGVLISEMRNKGLDFLVTLRLSVISHLPAFILGTCYLSFLKYSGLYILGSIFLSLIYLFFAVSSQDSPKPPPLK